MKITPITAAIAFLLSFSMYAIPIVLGGHMIVPWGLVIAMIFSRAEMQPWFLAVLVCIAGAQALTWFLFSWLISAIRSVFQAMLALLIAVPAYFLWLCFALGTLMQALPDDLLK